VLINSSEEEYKLAVNFCDAFLSSKDRPKYILGRNGYAESIAKQVRVDGFIDDFTSDKLYLGKPVYKTESVPNNSLVLSAATLRPLTAKRRLDEADLENLSYFTFYRHSGLPLKPISCWDDFAVDFNTNKANYNWIFDLLMDRESKQTFTSIVNFRLSGNLFYMKDFSDRQDSQYFEAFLDLKLDDEVFVDVGGFDGATSLTFIKKCPGYKAVHFFEPDKNNMLCAMKKLGAYKMIHYHSIGLSDKNEVVCFTGDGASSKIDSNGFTQIVTDKLDNIIKRPVSYIKMDIEGAERKALSGAKNIITQYHPKLAICVYHNGNDYWAIPKQVLSYRDDYDIYLRHYTEGVDETVMFFVPKQL